MNEANEGPLSDEQPLSVRRRRRWPMLLLFAAALVYAAPWAIGISGVAEQVTQQAMPWLPPGSKLGKPSLGWLSPVHLSGLRILDDEGRPILECAHVTSQKSLWEMATSPRSPGGWILEEPKVVLHVNPASNSLSPFLQRLLSSRTRAGSLPEMQVNVEKGRIEIRDLVDVVLVALADVKGDFTNKDGGGSLTAAGKLLNGRPSGGLDLQSTWTIPTDAKSPPKFHAEGYLTGMPLDPIGPWLAANMKVDGVSGSGDIGIDTEIAPSADGPTTVRAIVNFTPQGARYQPRGTDAWQPVPTMAIGSKGVWDPQADVVSLDQIRAQFGAMKFDGQGSISDPRGAAVVNLHTQADHDLSSLLDLLTPELRRHIIVNGLRARDVAIVGAMWPELSKAPKRGPQPLPLAVQGQVTWNDARIYGVNATPGAVTAAWTQSALLLRPDDVRVGEGRLVALPHVQLAQDKQLVADPGPLLVDVNITPEMCREWLKFVSPVVADSTSVEGKLTLELQSGAMPFSQPDKAEIAGTVKIHSATVSPGPLAKQQIAAVAGIVKLLTRRDPAWADGDIKVEMPKQDIRFRVHDGRVYHQGLQFQVGNLMVVSRGSVGLDHTLDMLIEIPLENFRDDSKPVASSILPKVITIPLGGTLERPQVDGRAMAEIGKSIGVEAAGGLLQKLLERGAEKAAERRSRRRGEPSPP